MAKPKKKAPAAKIKGSWFNAALCIVIFSVALVLELGFADAYLQGSDLGTPEELAGFLISIGYYFLFMGVLALGAIFNAISALAYGNFKKEYVKHPILVKIDNALDWALWGIVFYGSIAAFLINVIIIEVIIG
jgi:hypothetical protein